MMSLTNLTSRNLLIAIHDALATTAAVLASFYLRFEKRPTHGSPAPSAPPPSFLQSRLASSLLPLQIDHHQVAILLFAGCAEHSTDSNGANPRPSRTGLHFCRPERLWGLFLRQDNHHPVLVSGSLFPRRNALHLSLF